MLCLEALNIGIFFLTNIDKSIIIAEDLSMINQLAEL
jgi:hypothetical protein